MAKVHTKTKHYGAMRTLYERVSAYSIRPRKEIKRLASLALQEGTISVDQYLVLQHRVPFHGFDWESHRTLEPRLTLTYTRNNKLEQVAAETILRNLPRYLSQQSIPELPVDSLPWKRHPEELSTKGLLIRNLEGDEPTVGDAIQFLLQFYRKILRDPKYANHRFGPTSYRITSRVLERVGQVLPEI